MIRLAPGRRPAPQQPTRIGNARAQAVSCCDRQTWAGERLAHRWWNRSNDPGRFARPALGRCHDRAPRVPPAREPQPDHAESHRDASRHAADAPASTPSQKAPQAPPLSQRRSQLPPSIRPRSGSIRRRTFPLLAPRGLLDGRPPDGGAPRKRTAYDSAARLACGSLHPPPPGASAGGLEPGDLALTGGTCSCQAVASG